MFEHPQRSRDSSYSFRSSRGEGRKLIDRVNEEKLLFERFHAITQQTYLNVDGKEPQNKMPADGYRFATEDKVQKELVLITGRSGTGKSALAYTLKAPLERLGGFFLRGKFDQLRQNTAYAAFVHAFTDWTHQVLSRAEEQVAFAPLATENKACGTDEPSGELSGAFPPSSSSSMVIDLVQLRNDVNHATGGEAKILTQMIPALSDILGEQPDETPLCGAEARQRFFRVFRSFVLSICKAVKAPIVLFIDDLQWADKDSLDLVTALLADDVTSSSSQVCFGDCISSSRNLMILGACRENEVSLQHNLSCVLRSMEDDHGIRVTEIHLNNLGKEAVELLVSETLEVPVDRVTLLAEQIYGYTHGNVYSTINFLRLILESTSLPKTSEEAKERGTDDLSTSENLNKVDSVDWVRVRDILDDSMTLSRVRNFEESEYPFEEIDPVDLLRDRIVRLPHALQKAMKTMACLGAEFEEEVLLVALDDREEGERSIRQAKLAGLVDEVSNWLQGPSSIPRLCFSHDKVQEASYELIPEALKPVQHITIARRLRQYFLDSKHREHIIDSARLDRLQGEIRLIIVNQFLRGLSLIESEEERHSVAQLCCYVGGLIARTSSFQVAASYLEHAIALLPENRWSDDADCYELTLEVFTMAAEVQYSVGNYSRSDALVSEILDRARSLEDMLPAYTTRMYSLGSRQHLLEAIDTGLFVLKALGEPISRRPGPILLLISMMKTKSVLRRARWDRIMYLPLMEDVKKLAVMKLLNLMFTYTFSARPDIALLSTNLMVQLTVKHGLSAVSASGFGCNAMIMRLFLHDKESARRCGELAIKIVQRFHANEWVPRVYAAVYGMANSSNLPFRECSDKCMDAYRVGMMSGDTEFSMMSLCLSGFMRFCSSVEPFDVMYKDFVDHLTLMGSLHQDNVATYHACTVQAVSNILGEEKDHLTLTGKFLNEAEAIACARQQHNESFLVNIFVFKAFLAYLCNEYHEAELNVKSARSSRIGTASIVLINQLTFVECLTAISLIRSSAGINWERRRRAKQCLRTLRLNAIDFPTDLQHRVYFIEAEFAALHGRLDLAWKTYDKASNAARAEGHMNDVAMILEHKALVMLENGKLEDGFRVMQEAASIYAKCGAKIKVSQLGPYLNQSG